jgi:hypothetical protein
VRDVADQRVLSELRYVTAAELGWIRAATARLTARAARHGGPAGPRFVVFHGEVNEDADGPVEVCVPVGTGAAAGAAAGAAGAGAVEGAEAAGRVEPAHREAYIEVVKGHFEPPQILSIYDAVRRWVHDHGHTVVAPPREVYGYPVSPEEAAPGDVVCDVALPFR